MCLCGDTNKWTQGFNLLELCWILIRKSSNRQKKMKKEGGNSWKITQKSRKWPNSQACGISLQWVPVFASKCSKSPRLLGFWSLGPDVAWKISMPVCCSLASNILWDKVFHLTGSYWKKERGHLMLCSVENKNISWEKWGK